MKFKASLLFGRLIAFPLSGAALGLFAFFMLIALKIIKDPFVKFDGPALAALVACLAIPAIAGILIATLGIVDVAPIQRALSRITYTARLYAWVGAALGLIVFMRPSHDGLAILGIAAIALPCLGALIVGFVVPIVLAWIMFLIGLLVGFALAFIEVILDLAGERISGIVKRVLFAAVNAMLVGVIVYATSIMDCHGAVPSFSFSSSGVPGHVMAWLRPGFVLACAFGGWLALAFSQRDPSSKVSAIYNVYGFFLGSLVGVLLVLIPLPLRFDLYQVLAVFLSGLVVGAIDLLRKPRPTVPPESPFHTRKARFAFKIPMVVFFLVVMGVGFRISPEGRFLATSIEMSKVRKPTSQIPDGIEVQLENKSPDSILESLEYVTLQAPGHGANQIRTLEDLQLAPGEKRVFSIQDPSLRGFHMVRFIPRKVTTSRAAVHQIAAANKNKTRKRPSSRHSAR